MQRICETQRAIRRHHNARLKANRKHYWGGWVGNAQRIGMLLHTSCNCSCWMCGNPRKFNGNGKAALTIQELSNQEFEKVDFE